MVAAGLPILVASAGRTRAEQAALYAAWLAQKRPRNPPSVAKPGTSRHETGIALDVPESARTWMHKNGERFGWFNPEWAKRVKTFEPWHFEYDQTRDLSLVEYRQEEDIRFVRRANGTIYQMTSVTLVSIPNIATYEVMRKIYGGEYKSVNDAEFRALEAQVRRAGGKVVG